MKNIIHSFDFLFKKNKMNQDVQIVILSFLQPKDIISLYHANSSLLENLKTNIGFVVCCYEIISDDMVIWFQEKQIKIHLFQYHMKFHNYEAWYENGQLHRENNLPAMILSNYKSEWWLNGIFQREEFVDPNDPNYQDMSTSLSLLRWMLE